jgi:hypothetical protein
MNGLFVAVMIAKAVLQLQRLFCNCVDQIRLFHITLPFSGCSAQVRVELTVPHHTAMFVGFSGLMCVQHMVL